MSGGSTPVVGQTFWMLNSRFEVLLTQNSGSEKSRKRIAAGNWFRSKEEAEAFREHVLKGTTQIMPPIHIKVQYSDEPQIVPVRVETTPELLVNRDTVAINYIHQFMGNSLNHNAAIMELSAKIIAGGTRETKHQMQRIHEQYQNIHKAYGKENTRLAKEFTEEMSKYAWL